MFIIPKSKKRNYVTGIDNYNNSIANNGTEYH